MIDDIVIYIYFFYDNIFAQLYPDRIFTGWQGRQINAVFAIDELHPVDGLAKLVHYGDLNIAFLLFGMQQ